MAWGWHSNPEPSPPPPSIAAQQPGFLFASAAKGGSAATQPCCKLFAYPTLLVQSCSTNSSERRTPQADVLPAAPSTQPPPPSHSAHNTTLHAHTGHALVTCRSLRCASGMQMAGHRPRWWRPSTRSLRHCPPPSSTWWPWTHCWSDAVSWRHSPPARVDRCGVYPLP